jgi:hypothetical protein
LNPLFPPTAALTPLCPPTVKRADGEMAPSPGELFPLAERPAGIIELELCEIAGIPTAVFAPGLCAGMPDELAPDILIAGI